MANVWHRLNMEPKRLWNWYVVKAKSTPPPDIFKQRHVKAIGKRFDIDTFVETGTYKGDMTAVAARHFSRVYSIELQDGFYQDAVKRFSDNPQVSIFKGDSAKVLAKVLERINEPAVFWLDAHGGKKAKNEDGTDQAAPVREEVELILAHPLAHKHVILVDDVHTFIKGTKWGIGVWADLEELRRVWQTEHKDWAWQVKDNILHIHKEK